MKLDYDTAASLLSQLGNITRLKIVRELVRAGDSTLSHHLSHLRSVGLVRQEREATVLRCFVNYEYLEEIVSFLTEECCAVDPTYFNKQK
jgi:DNA-binding transcriptional ArsR family regulator